MPPTLIRFIRRIRFPLFALAIATPGPWPEDWAQVDAYSELNAALAPPAPGEDRVVFMGNSVIRRWAPYFPGMFPGKPYINRGIGGQTTAQVLARFRLDVIALQPKVVVILAGTNDIAGNAGPMTLEMIEANIQAMVELAKSNRIRVVLASVLPADGYPWRRDRRPAQKIVALNAWMKNYAEREGIVYLDYHSAMANEAQGLRSDLSPDGVHPGEAGYRVMAPLTEKAIRQVLANSNPQATTSIDRQLHSGKSRLLQVTGSNTRGVMAWHALFVRN